MTQAKSVSEIRDRIRETFKHVRPQPQFGYEVDGRGEFKVWCARCQAVGHVTSLNAAADWESAHECHQPIECSACLATKADVGEGDCCSTFWAKFTAVR